MSEDDIRAERDALAFPAGATDLPLVGLTIGSDGYWSARFWTKEDTTMHRHWCQKTVVIGPRNYRIYNNDTIAPPSPRRPILQRTFDTWGRKSQETISRLRIGIVGLGSVGSIVAEAIARIGISQVILVDPDRVEEHNLDRLLNAKANDIGRFKVDVASEAMLQHSTASRINIDSYPLSAHHQAAYRALIDCDLIFSCVDRPVGRDVLNYIAFAHLVPVIDGGVAVDTDPVHDHLRSAHWRAHLVTPYHQCMRCNKQYNTSMVILELDGSLDDPSYVSNLDDEDRDRNQNVFPFSLSVASMEVNMFIRYLIASDWWPLISQQEYQFLTARIHTDRRPCESTCSFRQRRGHGDATRPFYLHKDDEMDTIDPLVKSIWLKLWHPIASVVDRLFGNS